MQLLRENPLTSYYPESNISPYKPRILQFTKSLFHKPQMKIKHHRDPSMGLALAEPKHI